ncbi:TSUP family transporter [Butyricicoccus sp.]|uniref:TSUP family transporter n=1 Tax=Butyricicoccus sp. TaxID=2049021 RepID=UPI003F178080
MEFFWCFIAALGAGVGTGLAGLSAATVMVPILIVLCPSFAGETGAYHATAIALASDILGSAFTTGIYIRHKNIDLKRGWIMMACIIGMCIAGSFAAFEVGNVVLGGFSLFLCVGIGIRFLLRPDTQREETVAKGAKLDWKGVAVSLFFGLTIGFGTGFVGSGGGMMMLVVFTAFLGMDRKPAVGTSTFIMTFTALIAFISHSFIDSTILFRDWPILILCVATETIASIVSAQFANKVNNRIVGLVTGAVLTVLGIVMLGINYRKQIASCTLLVQVLRCMGWYLVFLAGIVVAILVLRRCFRLPDEVSRKLLQFPAMTSVLFMLYIAETWTAAVLCAVVFCLTVYPALCVLEKWDGYSNLFIERKPGEVKKSLFLLFGTHTILAAICCGLLNKPYIAAAAILVWGIADTAAALVGKRFGTHPIRLRRADPHKTWEGTTAMAVASFLTGAVVLLLASPLSWWKCILFSLVAAPFSAAAELYSHNGNDTVSVPAVVAAVLIIL